MKKSEKKKLNKQIAALRQQAELSALRQQAADNLRLLIRQQGGDTVLTGAQLEFDTDYLAKQVVSLIAGYTMACKRADS